MIHLKCKSSEVAKFCLLPGDPCRAELIAKKYLSNYRVINKHRGLFAYTGKWKNIPVSVFTTGMGCPSAGIVVEEIAKLGVKYIIRVGTCGGVQKKINPGDYIIPDKAIPLIGLLKVYGIKYTPQFPDSDIFNILIKSVENFVNRDTTQPRWVPVFSTKKEGQSLWTGTICTSDAFYKEVEQARKWESKGVLAFEMECAGIFALAKLRRIKAGTILTATGNILYGRQVMETPAIKKAIDRMILIALEAIKELKQKNG